MRREPISSRASSRQPTTLRLSFPRSGAFLPGVTITATNTGTGIVTTVLSNEAGAYQFASLQPATYDIKAELPEIGSVSPGRDDHRNEYRNRYCYDSSFE